MITDPAFYAVAAFAIILNGISKSGFAGAFAGIAVPLRSLFIAPLALIYLMPLRLEKRNLIATTAVFFAFLNFIKIPPYIALGQLNLANLSTALVLCLVTPVGIRIGIWLQGKVSTETVYRVGRIGLFLTGCKLIYDGVTTLTR